MEKRKKIHQQIVNLGGLTKLDTLSIDELKKLYALYMEDLQWIVKRAPLQHYNQMIEANNNARSLVNKAFNKKLGSDYNLGKDFQI